MTSYIDLNNTPDGILYDLIHSDDNIPIVDSTLFDYYKFLHLIRHNIFHALILKMFNKPWEEEKPLSEFFDFLPEEYSRKTPDIVFKREGFWYFIDVSISVDIANTEKNKKEKYQPIIDHINNYYKKNCAMFIHLNLNSNYSNIYKELNKIREIQLKDFNIEMFNRVGEIIEDKKYFVHQNINKNEFERLKKEYFAGSEKSKKEKKEILFKEELLYENIGNSVDIEIDQKSFKDYNNEFHLLEKIEETIRIFPKEEAIVEFFRTTFENKKSVYRKYADKKLDNEQFDEAKKAVKDKNDLFPKRRPKPTHHILFPLPDDIDPTEVNNNTEQQQILDFMKEYSENYKKLQPEEKTRKMSFFNDIFSEQLKCLEESTEKERNNLVFHRQPKYKEEKGNYDLFRLKLEYIKIFNNKKTISNSLLSKLKLNFQKDDKEKVKQTYNDYLQELEKYIDNKEFNLHSFSFRDYQKKILKYDIDENSSYVYKSKMIKLNFQNVGTDTRHVFDKSGIKADYEKIEVIERKTIELEEKVHAESFMGYLANKTKYKYIFKEQEFVSNLQYIGSDSPKLKIHKEEAIKNYTAQYNALLETNAYCYSHFARLFYKQLMHYVQYNTPNGTFAFFNCGLKNCLVVMAGTFNNSVHDYGKPFMCIIKTKYPELYTTFFGKIYKTKKINDYYYVYTNWRRLTLSKVTFMCDVFYSTLSSTMNTILSSSQVANYFLHNKIQKIYSLRVTIGYATSQKVAELLMDTRYAYMSSLSIYTNIGQLLKEKFGPPFSSCFEVWIIDRLFTRLKKINIKSKEDGILQTKAEMSHNVRDVNTIGGKIKIPSLWFDYDMFDITELTDEAFVYVHTMKEPANVFHENVKALKTIVAFQKEYDDLPNNIKYGEMSNLLELENFLNYDTKIGCSAGIIYNSLKHTFSKENPSIKKIVSKLNDENIGELLSTKAVIADADRKIVADDKPKQRDINKKLKRKKQLYDVEGQDNNENLTFYILNSMTKYYNKMKPRQKVMETILDKIEENTKLLKTVHLANYFIEKEKKVIADICIKAQYGAKREFYVVNIGAKAMARVTELFFRELCTNSPNEAISIPGDIKILEMQSMLDRIYYNPMTAKHKLMYVNGDCTKWSAAETMTSFISMTYGLKEHIPPNLYELLLATFNAWSNKEIQIPMDVFNKVVPTEKYHTNFLKDEHVLKTGKLKSTQNFLQGMFNYASSYKAVCCINYTYYIWKKIYPSSNLMIEHMEHSDDYVLVILYETTEEFEKFRVLQKMMMRLHGYNDSDRKTSCQPYLMEFVSQLSFNGVMLYPQIKKSKEINLSLPCTGYVTDMEAALSRVGECARVGCNQSFLYFFERLHCYCVAEAYSLLPGMENDFGRDYVQLLNTPIELFGIPDMAPIFSLYCKGNGNNYRIYKYHDKKLIHYLYNSALSQSLEEDYMSENIDYKFSLKRPNFLYEVFNKTISNLRKVINIDNEQITKFWEENITYKFLKPKDVGKLIIWIKCMFYNKTFLEAYAKSNRSMMTMRLSKFVKSKIIKDVLKINDYKDNILKVRENALTMKEYYEKTMFEYNNYIEKTKTEEILQIKKIITKCDPTYSAIYSIMDSISIIGIRKEKERTIQIATKTPIKLKTIDIQNEPGLLLQYLYDKENFILDKRILISQNSLERDIKEIKEKIPSFFLENRNPMNVLSVYNDLMINKEKRIVMFGFTRHITTLPESILEVLTFNYLPGHILHLTFNKVMDIIDPFTNNIIYSKGHRLTMDYYRQSCENICLFFVYFRYYCNYSHEDTIENLKNLKFEIKSSVGNEFLNFENILKKLDNFYITNFDYNLEDKKIVGYLRACLLGDYDVLDELVSSIYSFSYKYIIKDNLVGNKYLGETLLQFTYFNTTCKTYYEEKTNKNPLIIIQKYYNSISSVLYNIGIKMTIGMSDEEFEKTLNKERYTEITKKEINNFEKFIEKHGIVAVVCKKGEISDTIKIGNLKNDTKFLPFFITKIPIKRGGDIHFGVKKARPTIDNELLAVYMGKSKLYTLPFWKCKQHPNITVLKDKIIQNMYYSELCKNALLEKFVREGIDRYTICSKKVVETPEDMSFNFKKELYKYKIYDIDWTTIIKTKAIYLNDVLKSSPSTKQTYERKFLKEIIPIKPTITVASDQNLFFVNSLFGVEIKQKDYKNIDEMLRKNALEIDFEDDFLIDEEEENIPTMIEEIDEDYPIVTPQYIGKEMVNLQNMNIPYTDIFVEKPKRKKTNYKEGIGYMLMRLKNQKPIYLKLLLNEYEVPNTPNYMNIMNIITELNIVKKYFENIHKLNNQERMFIYLKIYKLICDTFIIIGDSSIYYQPDTFELSLLRKFKIGDFTEKQLDKLKQTNKIYGERENFIYIKVNYEHALKVYQDEITDGKTKRIDTYMGNLFEIIWSTLLSKEIEPKELKYMEDIFD